MEMGMLRLDEAFLSIRQQLLTARTGLGFSQERVAHDAQIAVNTFRRLETRVGDSSVDSLLRSLVALRIDFLRLSVD